MAHSPVTTRGFFLPGVLVFAAVSAMLITAVVGGANAVVKQSRSVYAREQAFQIAEAGIEYYRWHLAHAPTDYQDGTAGPGPYTHLYYDKAGQVVGSFTLTITPPPAGSTIVTILSEGTLAADPSISRKLQVRFAIPSLAKYAVAANAEMRFGEGTETYGPIHSNYGIRFDGIAHNIITSSVTTYNDPDHTGNNEYGVHTHVNPPPGTGVNSTFRPAEAPPNTLAARADVFLSGRQVGVPAIDFAGITADLATMKADAQSGGVYHAPSGGLGYHIVLKTNDTFDLYRVNSTVTPPSGCTNINDQDGWGTWSIRTGGETLLGNYAFPANGIIFVEDHVWVDGQINTARLTIASGRFPDNPATRTSIVVNRDLLYTNYDGSDSIALVAQNNFSVGMVSEDDLRIDAALVAQYGRAGRYYYRPSGGGYTRCSPYHQRDTLTLYGMIGTAQRYGFAYTDGTGYDTRNIVYDGNLLYAPPPAFPLATDQYQVISWEEVQ